MLFLAPPSAPSVDGDDSAGYTDTPPTQRRRDAAPGRAVGGRDTARDGGQRRRNSGRAAGGTRNPRSAGSHAPTASADGAGGVKMTRGARRSATDFGITDAEVANVLAAPSRVAPEQDNPDRTRFSGAGLTVVTGADGTVLHVSRRR
ncbi:hypothetical protein [Cryptosporangium aurantiacum]|uniref:Uncharacterized protein n=1 Tax=Cryptosporangium aurantiacum TaxID=134849 RepID=A0A1M7JFH6_9ACTN|nr:hypothetical protein [Cryptosporangium aurantiacum]SHM51744.1 hypothetical protein SAMN05443668_101780 [Cryptosporangium aurantiacum]